MTTNPLQSGLKLFNYPLLLLGYFLLSFVWPVLMMRSDPSRDAILMVAGVTLLNTLGQSYAIGFFYSREFDGGAGKPLANFGKLFPPFLGANALITLINILLLRFYQNLFGAPMPESVHLPVQALLAIVTVLCLVGFAFKGNWAAAMAGLPDVVRRAPGIVGLIFGLGFLLIWANDTLPLFPISRSNLVGNIAYSVVSTVFYLGSKLVLMKCAAENYN